MKSLEKWNALRSAIVEAKTVDEVKNIRDKAQVMKAYAKQIGESLECQNDISEIKIRAEHRVGEMLLETEKNQGGRPAKKNNPSHDVRGRIHIKKRISHMMLPIYLISKTINGHMMLPLHLLT